MERAAEIAALIFTARDALLRDTAADLRVSFLLFDSAVETLMVRALASDSSWRRFDRSRMTWATTETLRQIDLNDSDQQRRDDPDYDRSIESQDLSWITGALNWYLSPTQQRSVERNFDDKLRLLAWDQKIPRDFVAVTSRLHEYRNEMYHREEIRPNALKITAHLYALVVTQFLEFLPPQWISMGTSTEEFRSRVFSRLSIPAPTNDDLSWLEFGGVQRLLAEDLRTSLEVTDARSIIGDYIRERVAEVHENMKFVGGYAHEFDRSVTVVTDLDVVRLIYTSKFLSTFLERRGEKAPVTAAALARWDSWADEIPQGSAALAVFSSLAKFETEFEPFELKVREASSDVDSAIQSEIDRLRGK
jgi:hypothetical protein